REPRRGSRVGGWRRGHTIGPDPPPATRRATPSSHRRHESATRRGRAAGRSPAPEGSPVPGRGRARQTVRWPHPRSHRPPNGGPEPSRRIVMLRLFKSLVPALAVVGLTLASPTFAAEVPHKEKSSGTINTSALISPTVAFQAFSGTGLATQMGAYTQT